jgi:replicative DNA helicase
MSSENPVPNEDIARIAEKEEPRFLNILLKDKESLSNAIAYGIKYTENHNPGHFFIPKNNLMYKLIHQNFIKYGTLLTRSAMDSIVDMQSGFTEEEKAAMKGYWDKIWNRHDVSLEDYELLKEHMNDRYILWQFYDAWKAGDKIIKSTVSHTDLVQGFVKKLNALDNMNPDPYSLTMGLDKGVKEAMKYIKDRREHPEKNDAIKTGIDGIDKIYHGFARGTYTIISGIVNGGKTTTCMNIAFNMAKAGYKVAYVSLEKTAELFFRRILCLHALTDYNRTKTGGTGQYGLNDFWYKKLEDAEKDLANIQPNLDVLQFVQGTKLTRVLNELDRLISMKGKLDVLIIDYPKCIAPETNHPNRPDIDAASVHKRFMAYGKIHNLVTFAALQLKSSSSKEIRKKAEKVTNESQMSSISVDTEDYADSQMIIADADNAIGVVLDAAKPATKMFVSISKARDDESRRTICLDFDGKLGRISDPQYGAAQIKAVDDILFNKDMTTDKLESEEDLFKEVDEKVNKIKKTRKTESKDTKEESKEIVEKKEEIPIIEEIEENVLAEDTENIIEDTLEEKDEDRKGLDITEELSDNNDPIFGI